MVLIDLGVLQNETVMQKLTTNEVGSLKSDDSKGLNSKEDSNEDKNQACSLSEQKSIKK